MNNVNRISTAAVLGAGTMGHAIANNLASHGVQVHLYESFDNVRETVMDRIRAELELMVQEGYFPPEKLQETLDHISLFSDLKPAVEDVDRALMFGPCFRNAVAGMLECADLGWLDVWYAAESNFFPDLANTATPAASMKKLVDKGNYGIKTGKGFYDYPEESRAQVTEDFNRRLIAQLKVSRELMKRIREKV